MEEADPYMCIFFPHADHSQLTGKILSGFEVQCLGEAPSRTAVQIRVGRCTDLDRSGGSFLFHGAIITILQRIADGFRLTHFMNTAYLSIAITAHGGEPIPGKSRNHRTPAADSDDIQREL